MVGMYSRQIPGILVEITFYRLVIQKKGRAPRRRRKRNLPDDVWTVTSFFEYFS